MGDMLSQDEINALLGNTDLISGNTDADSSLSSYDRNILTSEEKDILGELGNISMGTSATTLFALLNQKVGITTPIVKVMDWHELSESYDRPCVGIRVDYKEGLIGSNILVLKQNDVKIIACLMMGGDGSIDKEAELTELDLSAIAEAMNQMVGSSSTSLSSMLNHKIDIDTPKAFVLNFKDDTFFEQLGFKDEIFVCTTFKMEIGSLIDSEIMQILPIDFALEMVSKLKSDMSGGSSEPQQQEIPQPVQMQEPIQPPPSVQPVQMPPQAQNMMPPPYQQQYDYNYVPPQPSYPQQPYNVPPPQQSNVNVQPVQFQNFDVSSVMQQKENIGIIMDVPLEITVELGRTHKLIKEILEFSPGTIVELDKLAGEPIDILVNGKFIAKGEVVVIDENFGIRITDIVNSEDRI